MNQAHVSTAACVKMHLPPTTASAALDTQVIDTFSSRDSTKGIPKTSLGTFFCDYWPGADTDELLVVSLSPSSCIFLFFLGGDNLTWGGSIYTSHMWWLVCLGTWPTCTFTSGFPCACGIMCPQHMAMQFGNFQLSQMRKYTIFYFKCKLCVFANAPFIVLHVQCFVTWHTTPDGIVQSYLKIHQ